MMESKYKKGDTAYIVDAYAGCYPRIMECRIKTVGFSEQYGYIYIVRTRNTNRYALTEDEIFTTEEKAREYITNRIQTVRL